MILLRSRRRRGRLIVLGLSVLLLYGPMAQAQVQRARKPIPLTPQQSQRFEAMLPNLRCLVCQNESLAESQAPLAMDLRYQIRGMLAKGDTDAQIKHYLVDRYGEYVLYTPRFRPGTWLLWLGPLLLLVIALFIAFRMMRRRGSAVAREPAPVDNEALRRLLDEDQ